MNNSIIDAIFANLQQHYAHLGETYFGKSMNRFQPHYLFDTPINRKQNPLPDNHSQAMTDMVTNLVANARYFVDITNLGLPGGGFTDAIIEGINRNPDKITIRILCGRGNDNTIDTDAYVKHIQKQINNKPVTLHVGVQQLDRALLPRGWNHSKYVAVDGKAILFGGHNFITEPYFGKNPIFDLSIRLDGPMAIGAHLFSNALWTFVNQFVLRGPGFTTFADSLENGIVHKRLAPIWNNPVVESGPEHNVPVIHVAQPGLGILDDPQEKHPNPSLTAMYTAIAQAQNEICISQQDIGGEGGISLVEDQRNIRFIKEGDVLETIAKVPFVGIKDPKFTTHNSLNFFDVNLFNNLYMVLINKPNVQVKIVLTNQGSTNENGKIAYSYGASYASVYRAFGWFLIKRGGRSFDQAFSILMNQVRVNTIGFDGEYRWRIGHKRIIGNHSKYWSVDNAVCYIGSHNMYPSTKPILSRLMTGHLQEWGAVIGNNEQNVVGNIQERYFNDLFNHYSIDQPVETDFLKGL